MVGDDMVLIIIILCGVFLLGILIILGIIQYKKFQWTFIKIEKGLTNLETLLRHKYELLSDYLSYFKEKIKIDDNDIKDYELLNLNIDIAVLDKTLNEMNLVIDNYITNNEELAKDENILKLNKDLSSITLSINALKKYYNEKVNEYNILCSSFPSSIYSKIFRYKKKEYFEDQLPKNFKINEDDEEQ